MLSIKCIYWQCLKFQTLFSEKIFLINFLTGKRKFFFENIIVQHASVIHWDCFSSSSHLVLLHFTPTVVASLKIRKRMILKKSFHFQLLFNTFASASNLFYQSASSSKKTNRFRFHIPGAKPWQTRCYSFYFPSFIFKQTRFFFRCWWFLKSINVLGQIIFQQILKFLFHFIS